VGKKSTDFSQFCQYDGASRSVTTVLRVVLEIIRIPTDLDVLVTVTFGAV
jgi:hypothetical protein